jgi:hypothetical protein
VYSELVKFVQESYENNLDKVFEEKGIRGYKDLRDGIGVLIDPKVLWKHLKNKCLISTPYALVYREILEVEMDELYRKKIEQRENFSL